MTKTYMTNEEVESNFPIASIVEVINNKDYEDICYLGEKAKVISYNDLVGLGYTIEVQFLKTKRITRMFPYRFKSCNSVIDIDLKNNSSCPKCNGPLKEQWSDWAKANIKKCSNCGWC